ncbi:hypothetical protein C5Y96_03620 [Blastopirellula marina]|uniref:DUF1795 domain-containing protein n=1 Tax=Blastopirellula marina TaxID=124 RepID=A0A2S8G3H9_9BACT|nr:MULTISPECIES: hypothetical protein [Pirellulaceae]PQO38973.1 hypothetical protein C5Y96_03620 [Blastopirellula marina]RCS55281.1 hypothetical protein DTL36_03625 [Bremerella cremea]
MIKSAALVLSLLIASHALAADDYVLTVNGKPYDIGLDSTKEVTLPGGEVLKVELKMKDELQYDRPYFTFKHSSKFRPSTSDLGGGVHQTVLATPEGTGVFIQEYDNTDPTFLVGAMLNELTKEEVQYGYAYKDSTVSKNVGKLEAKGKQAVTTYKDDNWVREVYSIPGRDCGLLIFTQIETNGTAKEQEVIDKFWKSLEVRKLR